MDDFSKNMFRDTVGTLRITAATTDQLVKCPFAYQSFADRSADMIYRSTDDDVCMWYNS